MIRPPHRFESPLAPHLKRSPAIAPALVCVLTMFCGQPAHAQSEPEEAKSQTAARPPSQRIAFDISADQTSEARLGAIRAMRKSIDEQPSAVDSILTRDRLEALAQIAIEGNPEERLPAISLLACSTSRVATQALITLIAPNQPEPGRSAAFQALAVQTGRESPGTNYDAWKEWWDRAQWLTEGEWRAELTRQLTARNRRLLAERQALAQRVVDLSSDLYASSSLDTRSQRLVEMLTDSLPALRLAGVNLAERELLNARQVSPQVGDLAVELLSDPDPQIRERAAALLVRLSVARAPQAAVLALRSERSPETASSLLMVAAKSPTLEGVLSAAEWIGRSPSTWPAASELIYSAWRQGVLTDPVGRIPALKAIRTIPIDQLPPSAVRVRIEAGDGDDRSALRPLLTSTNNERKIAAGSALGRWPDSFEWLIEAAANDPSLRPAAIRSIIVHRPGLAGWRLAESLPSSEGREFDWRGEFAQAMPPQELATVIQGIEDPNVRITMLEHLSSSRDTISQRIRSQLLANLADAHLEVGDPASALDVISQVSNADARPEVVAIRLRALVQVGRLEEAGQLDAAPDVWIAAAKECLDRGSEFTTDVRDLVAQKFGASMSPEQRVAMTNIDDALALQAAEEESAAEEVRVTDTDGEGPGV